MGGRIFPFADWKSVLCEQPSSAASALMFWPLRFRWAIAACSMS